MSGIHERIHNVRVEVTATTAQLSTMLEFVLEEGWPARSRLDAWAEWTELTLARHEELNADLTEAGLMAADDEAVGKNVGLSAVIVQLIPLLNTNCELLRTLHIVLGQPRRAVENSP